MKLKTKLGLGLTFLFVVIITFGVLSIFYINRLSDDSKSILKNNLESLAYSNNMLTQLESIPLKKQAIIEFDNNLKKQETNITEPGESEATAAIRRNFLLLSNNNADSNTYSLIRQSIQLVNEINQRAIVRKNEVAKKTAEDAILWLSIIFVVLGLISFTFVVNFPSIISTPIRVLNDGIDEIANKNYSKRIYLKQTDEFGDLANAFNSMAERLDEYENSNLAKLRFEKSRIETIINQMKDGIIGLDTERNILFLNKVAENLLGLKETEIMGKYIADIAVNNDLVRNLIQTDNGKELKIFADGKESYFNKDFLDVTNNDEKVGHVIILKNITFFYELNEAKTNFIATVSHELKTPISSIKLSAQLLNDKRIGALSEEQRDYVKSIVDDAERLLKITSELLNLTQVETGRLQFHFTKVAPAEIINDGIAAVLSKAKEKNILINNTSPANLQEVELDADKTTWVINNLLTNAIKYSYNNGIIEVSVTEQNNYAVFLIRDFGTGIVEEHLPKLFDRYFQVPGSKEKGTGLGLSIAKDFIEEQGGKIWIESEIGKGTSAYFQLHMRSNK